MKIAKKILLMLIVIGIIVFSTYITHIANADCSGNCGRKHKWSGGQYYNFTDSSKFITSTDYTTWELGRYIGIAFRAAEQFDTRASTGGIHIGTFIDDFIARSNKQIYCIESGQDLSNGRQQYVAKVEITGDTVTATRYNNTSLQGQKSNNARKETRMLVEILRKGKIAADTRGTYRDRDNAYVDVGVQALRDRGESRDGFSYKADVYQRILWNHLANWRNSVFGSGTLDVIGSTTGSKIDPGRNDAKYFSAAETEAQRIFNEEINIVAVHENGAERESAIGIADKSTDDIKNNNLKVQQKVGNDTVLGPFKYDYSGMIEEVKIYFNNNKSKVTTAIIGTWSGSVFKEVSVIPDNSNFYIKLPSSFLTSQIKTLNIEVKLSANEQKTTLYLLKDMDGGQNQMFVEQEIIPLTHTGNFSYTIETAKTVTLEKKSTDGIMLPNVKFKLYDGNGTYINTYTTGTTGKISIPNIEIGKNYILEETSNKSYGLRGANIANATITSGGTIININKENRKITFKLTDDATLRITNTINLGNLTIRKVDNTQEELPIQDVAFAIWDMSVGGWIRLYNSNTSEFIEEIDQETEINILDYKIEPATSDFTSTPPTKFITNSKGEIIIKNLQIDHSTTQKDHYLVAELVNNNYGYKGMILESGNIEMSTDKTRIIKEGSARIENGSLVKFDGTGSCIRQKDKSVKFTIDRNTILTIENKPKLGDLAIIKTGEDDKPLPNVKFAVWLKEKGFIRLTTGTTFKEEIKSTNDIDVLNYKIGYTVDENEATKFVTNSDGKINITNLEVYSGVDSQGNAISSVYTVREVENENYGYKAMILEQNTVTINEKPIGANNLSSSVDKNKKEIKFAMQGDTVINIENTPKFGNLTIKKVGGDGITKQQGVEFELWQLEGGYVRLFTEEEYKEGETKLEFVDAVKSKNGEPIDFKNYVIKYVTEVTENTLPTRFITNELGEIQINNLEIYHKPGVQNHHFISEVKNDNYGYKGMIIEKATIVGGKLTNFDNTESYIRQRDRAVKFTITENTKLTIKNKPQLGNVLINKESTDGEVLQNVEFIMTRGKNEYIVLKDSRGKNLNPNKIDAEAIIDNDGRFGMNEYSITYSTNKDDATVFITGKEGTIDVKNLEVYQPYVISRPKPVSSEADKNTEVVDTQPTSYSYTLQELSNPNYGYALTNTEKLLVTIKALNVGQTEEVTVQNESATRNLEILKKDADAKNIKLCNVGFAIYTTTEGSGKKGYLSVYDEKNKFQATINKEITINDGYRLEYKYFYDEYEDLEDNQQSEITIFETNADGKININNLEVYERETGKAYQYQVEEVYNKNFGYEIDYETIETIVLKKQNEKESDTKSVSIPNEQVYAKLSGYVWKEYADPKKTSPSDLLYTESTPDIKLTDLYMWNENKGVYEQNPYAEIPVKILLRDKKTNKTREPDEFIYKLNDSTEKIKDAGKYTFEVEIAKLADYEIVFEYDGFYYSTVIPNTQADNGSKAVENEKERTELNQKFGTVESGDKIVSSDGKTENGVIYDEIKDQKSSLLGFVDGDLTKLQAETIINLSEIFQNAKANSEVPVEGIDNINMGLAQREQPILWVTSSIDNLEVNLKVDGDEHKYIYDYKDGERQYLNEEYYFDKESGEYKQVSVKEEKSLTDKFEEENQISTLKQTVVKSDLQAVEKNNQIEMDVSMIYKISLNNASGKLTSVVHEIKNYFDPRLSIEEIGLSINNNQIGDIIYKADLNGNPVDGLVNIDIEENVTAEYGEGIGETTRSEYTPARIPLGTNGIRLEALKTRNIYIKYGLSLSGTTLEEILSGNAVYYNNAAEIIKYSSYYENSLGKGMIEVTNNGNTQKFNGDIITENQNSSRTGQIYAGINQGSRPDNINLKLIKNEQNNALIFDTSEFEVDSTAAQTIVFVAEGVRTISGTIFEDHAVVTNNEKNGDGKFDANVDSLISNVKVELYKVADNGAIVSKATYANGKPIVTEAINGKYTLGGYNDDDGITYGILPGKYIIQYTYGLYKDENNKDKQTYVGNKNDGKYTNEIKLIDMMDYKSTIIPGESSLQKEFKNKMSGTEINKSWFTLQGQENYSTAIDNLQLRPEYSAPVSSVTFGKIKGTGLTITSQNGSIQRQPIGSDAMTAQTLPMDINIQFTQEKGRKVVIKGENGEIKYNELKDKLENVNFGIVERPSIDIKIDKKITNIEVIVQNGASIIPKGNPRESKMDYITAPKNEDTISAQVDTKLLHGATLNLEYTVTVENNSNIDYICKEYYYFGEKNEEFENTPTAKLVVDYLDATMELDESKNENGVWKKETADSLKSNEYIDSNVYSELTLNKNNQKYYVYTTSAFEDVKIGDAPKEEKMYVSKKLSISEDITEAGRVEIIEIAGQRAITGAIPGNYNPAESLGTSGDSGNKNDDYLNEPDWSKDQLKIIPPTGTIVDYKMYTIATVAMLTILTIGIILIKKKVII